MEPRSEFRQYKFHFQGADVSIDKYERRLFVDVSEIVAGDQWSGEIVLGHGDFGRGREMAHTYVSHIEWDGQEPNEEFSQDLEREIDDRLNDVFAQLGTPTAAPSRRFGMRESLDGTGGGTGFRPRRMPTVAGESAPVVEGAGESAPEPRPVKRITAADVKTMRTTPGATIFEFPFDTPPPRPWIHADRLALLLSGSGDGGKLSVEKSGDSYVLSYGGVDGVVEIPASDVGDMLADAGEHMERTRAAMKEFRGPRAGSDFDDDEDEAAIAARSAKRMGSARDPELAAAGERHRRASDTDRLKNWERSWKG